jgi:cyclophilin family peptidyl-prolyl cis-trans isomerase
MLHQEVVIRDIDLWKKITPELLKLFSLKDQGTLAILASIFADPALPVTAAVTDPSAIRSAQAALVLPRDIETHNEMQRAITRMEGSEFEPMKVSYNHPINWEKVKGLGKKIVVDVSTSKGDFVIELDVESAPGSVLNFVELVESGYFNGKFFHRVVPNFVIQTGCPIGDGYGGLEHTIRSEFATHDYRTGAVGLASAGKDTESCQWFVTHLPTFGLEGRYTIIGYVTEGMSTVQAVSVGDVINKVTIR